MPNSENVALCAIHHTREDVRTDGAYVLDRRHRARPDPAFSARSQSVYLGLCGVEYYHAVFMMRTVKGKMEIIELHRAKDDKRVAVGTRGAELRPRRAGSHGRARKIHRGQLAPAAPGVSFPDVVTGPAWSARSMSSTSW